MAAGQGNKVEGGPGPVGLGQNHAAIQDQRDIWVGSTSLRCLSPKGRSSVGDIRHARIQRFVKSGLPFDLLVRISEGVIREIGCAFAKNISGDIVELEVRRPEEFVVRFQKLPEVEFGSALFGALWTRRFAAATSVSIVLGPHTEASKRMAAIYVKTVMDRFPDRPWRGLRLVEQMTARSQWMRWAEGRESG